LPGVSSGDLAHHQAFEQGVARQAIRAMHARGGDLPRGVQPRKARTSAEIGRDPTDEIVRGGSDRYRVERWVYPAPMQLGRYRWKPALEVTDGARVEEAASARGEEQQGHRATHDVAWGQFSLWMHVRHEPATPGIDEPCPLAPYRFA